MSLKMLPDEASYEMYDAKIAEDDSCLFTVGNYMAEYSLEDTTGMVIYKVGMKEVQESVDFVRGEIFHIDSDFVFTKRSVKILFAFGDIGIRCENATDPQRFSLYVPSIIDTSFTIHPKALPLILHRCYTEFAPRDHSNWFIFVREINGETQVIDIVPTDSWVNI